ncbi:uncharacterized protein LOC143294202 [Babylonia areolata]|uniref:uncharacterized protein LOC143294202 n=1 Tax=Babylonia areolata TaxID=304850 RepID=UPI003FD0BA1F
MKHVDAETGTIREIPLAEIEVEADLGVQVDNDLKFKQHVDSVTARANSVIGIIRRTFEFLDCKLFIQLYKTIARPILEYAQTVWQPRHKTLCKQLEDVQRRATKLISSISELPYAERLERLGLPSLEHRRLIRDMIDTFKYVHGLHRTEKPKLETAEEPGTRGNTKKLFPHHTHCDTRKHFFSERVTKTWNSLPHEVVLAPSVNAFKNRLDVYWKNKPDKYNPSCQ